MAKLQCEQGALFSYPEAQSNLGQLNTYHRSVNSHTQISRLTDQVGAILSQQHLVPPMESACAQLAPELTYYRWMADIFRFKIKLSAALKLYPRLFIDLKVSRLLTNILEKLSINPVRFQLKMTS